MHPCLRSVDASLKSGYSARRAGFLRGPGRAFGNSGLGSSWPSPVNVRKLLQDKVLRMANKAERLPRPGSLTVKEFNREGDEMNPRGV